MALALLSGESLRTRQRTRPDPHAVDSAHSKHGLEVAPRLLAGAQDDEIPGVLPGQQPGRQAAGGGGTDGGDLGRIEQGHRSAVLRLEQQDQAEMGGKAGGGIAREQADQLDPEALGLRQIARHIAHQTAA